MPRTKKQPDPTPQSPAVNGSEIGEVLTLAEVATYLRLPEQDVLAAVSAQALPGRRVNGQWRFLKTAVQQWLSACQPAEEIRKAAILAAAGTFRDDPDLIPMVEAIYRKRGRPITADGSYHLLHGLEPASEAE